VAEGCTEFNLIPQGPDPEETIARTAEVKRLLAARTGTAGAAMAGAAAVAAGPR
jgi:hypothetical protein